MKLSKEDLANLNPDLVWLYNQAYKGATTTSAKMRIDRIMRRQFPLHLTIKRTEKHTNPEE